MNSRALAAAPLIDEHELAPGLEPTPADDAAPVARHPGVRWRSIHVLRFFGLHLAVIGAVVLTGWSWSGLGLAVALYFARMFFLTAGYHRYFSHRSFKAGRVVQFLLALGGTTCLQKGVLWWASMHRHHHRFSDQPQDPHSPRQRGFWMSHVLWVLSSEHGRTQWGRVRDLSRFPELCWLNRHYLLPPLALAGVLFALGGTWALVWGFGVSTVLLWHGTFTINSLAHVIGKRRYATADDSKNSFPLALITMGEGWHNNHHHYQSSANQGFRWWEVDVTYYILRALELVHVISDVRRAPAHVVAAWDRSVR